MISAIRKNTTAVVVVAVVVVLHLTIQHCHGQQADINSADHSTDNVRNLVDACSGDVCTVCECRIAGLQFLKKDVFCTSRSIKEIPCTWVSANTTGFRNIDFSNNDISVISDDDLQDPMLDTVASLDLRHNKLTEITAKTFTKMTRLEKLYLQHNFITKIDTGAFVQSTQLTSLDLTGNLLTEIPAGLLDGLEKLTDLLLVGNPITAITTQSMGALVALTSLDLSGLGIVSIESKAFSGMAALESLDISNNRITTIPTAMFDGLAALTTLSLKNLSSVVTIEKSSFAGLQKVAEIDLSSTLITELSSWAFTGITALTTLKLPTAGTIKLVDTGAFDGSFIKNLDLSGQRIDTLRDYAFNGATSLSSIDLTSNQLKSLTKFTFADDKEKLQIEQLTLANNNITYIPEGMLPSVPKLKILDLTNNNLIYLKAVSKEIEDLSDLENLCLGGNDLDCCGLEWLRDSSFLDYNCVVQTTCIFSNDTEQKPRLLSSLDGQICAGDPKPSPALSDTELIGICVGAGVGVIIFMSIIIVVVRRRSGKAVEIIPERLPNGEHDFVTVNDAYDPSTTRRGRRRNRESDPLLPNDKSSYEIVDA